MKEQVDALLGDAASQIAASLTLKSLAELRVRYLGKKGALTELLKQLGQLPLEERKAQGQVLNRQKQALEAQLTAQEQRLQATLIDEKLKTETIDITRPGRNPHQGSLHPLSQTLDWIVNWFSHQGFSSAFGPDIENDYYNFEALNIPFDHPARDMHDTFYLSNGAVLRTHTSPVQIRAMEHNKPPFRLIAPGRTYRCDSDATHTPQFHQIEGLMVSEAIHLGHLKGTLNAFLRDFFGHEIEIRWRTSYFPFTEPSAEIDIRAQSGPWLEILGAGLVHPKVLENCGLDAERYTGFAFGMGLERLTMLAHGIRDIRWFFENDLRFLKQF